MAKRLDDNIKYLSQEELATLNRVLKDIFFFSQFIYVIHPVRGRVRFDLYPYQKSVVYNFLKYRFNIILKFRQAGITELISMFCLWLCLFHPNKKVNIISIKDTIAKKVLKKIKFMYKNLPWYMQTPVVNGRVAEVGTSSSIEFSNGSLIESIPTSEQAGRSESLSLLVIDEAAIVRWANQIMAAALPTLSCAVGTTPILKRTYKTRGKYTKAHTEIIQLKDICPSKVGQIDISSLGLYTLTHTGQWSHITHSQNKGELETWYVRDNHGKVGGYTPAHRLFTTNGWKTVKEIVENNLNIISVDTKVDNYSPSQKTKAPDTEVIKPIDGFPEYFISNFGKVYKNSKKNGFVDIKPRANKDGYLRVGLTKPGVYRTLGDRKNRAKSKLFQRSIHSLVAEAFIGPKPIGYQVDHIDNIRTNNYSTNLRYITTSDNIAKSYSGVNLNALLVSISNDKLPELLKRGKILELAQNGYSYHKIAKEIYPDKKQGAKFVKRILNDRQGRVYISKLEITKITKEIIYDIHVEGDESYITANNFVNHNTGGSAILNSCITGDTKIITDKGLLRVKDICPKSFGAVDLSMVSNLRVLTHKGEWKRVVASVNKGKLETWKIKTKFGNTLKCTPDHKLYTLNGFMSVRDIVEKGEEVILYHTGISGIQKPPSIQWPAKEEWKLVNGYSNYMISNRGELKYLRGGEWYNKNLRPNKLGYIRVNLYDGHGNTQKFRMADLVISHFTNLKVGKNQVIDHIDCIPAHNWVTNLRVISRKENTQRASLYSYGLKLGTRTGKGFSDLDSIATIKRALATGELKSGHLGDFIKNHPDTFKGMSTKSIRNYINKIINGSRGKQVELSKLTVVKKFKALIYDITVEDHHSYITYNYKTSNEAEFNFINKNTPYGIGGLFHQTWVDALSGSNNFNPIRLRWQMHPERDQKWYDEMSANLGPKRTAQEIDGDFLSSGNTVFDLVDIKAIEECLTDYPVIMTKFNGQYREFNEPEPDKEYFIGADIATGRSLDYSSFTCMDKYGEEASVYKGRMPVNKFAKLLGDTGIRYNEARLAPETNDIGLAVTAFLQAESYPNLYYSRKFLKAKHSSKPKEELVPGWVTTGKNRTPIIDGLEQDIREGNLIIKDPFFVQEAYTFIYDQQGRPIAKGKRTKQSDGDIDLDESTYSDDDIMGKAITNHIRKVPNNRALVLPQ